MDGNVENNQALNELKGKIIRIPRVDDTLSREGYAADAKKTGDALNEKLNKTDVVDNLTTDDDTKPLSARQGTVIKKQLDNINLSEAGAVGYNNETSGLEATNMQSAIDEVASKVKTQGGYIDDLALAMDAFEENYLSKNGGGMVTGGIHFRNADNGYSSLNKNNSATTDYGTKIIDRTKDNKNAYMTICAAKGEFSYTNTSGVTSDIFTEENKPFVEYKGNGSATPRTIATKGIGKLALVYCSTHQALVSPKGADVVDLTTGERKWIDSGKVSFLNGNLNTATSNAAFNTANETYYVQVL